MFETNIQCLAHILTLQKEKSQLDTDYKLQINELNNRINTLTEIVETQQNELDKSTSTSRLSTLWNKILTAHRSYAFNNQFNGNMHSDPMSSTGLIEESSNTLAILSNYFANEIKTINESQYSLNSGFMRV